jgi:DNA polymerase bacteriophage-type
MMRRDAVLAGEVFVDVETASEIDLPAVGSDVYFTHPSTRVICLEGITLNEETISWTEGEPPPKRLIEMVLLGWTFVAHGQVFERLAFERILVPKHGFPMPQHWACSMMRARYNGLPAALEFAAQACGLPIEKDMAGARLMRTMCRPRSYTAEGQARWWHLEDLDKLKRLKAYCLQDCKVSMSVWRYTRTPPPEAQAQYEMIARMNKRGVQVDLRFARAAVQLAKRAREKIDQQIRRITQGAVDAATKVAQLKAWIALFGIELTSLDKRDVQRFLAQPGEDIPEPVRQAIVLRLDAAKSSVSKFEAMLKRANLRGRVEDVHVWHGASTGRLSSQGLQAQNFRREIHPQAERAMQAVHAGDLQTIELLFGEPLELLSTLLRPALIPQPGRQFVGGDLSQIEARILAWIANDQPILELFRKGADVYKYVASQLFRVSTEQVSAEQRQAGKVADLAFGFGGAMGALQAMTRQYGMPAFEEDEAKRLVAAWRESHPLYLSMWRAFERAAKAAVIHPYKPWRVPGPVDLDFAYDGRHLYLRLPSGRLITYRDVQLEDRPTPWGEVLPALVASGVNSMTRRYERYALSRVILVENAVQGIAADIMLAGALECDRSRYEPVLSVHDELVCEPPPELLEEAAVRIGWVMTQPLEWSRGLPLAVKTWRGDRYLKR